MRKRLAPFLRLEAPLLLELLESESEELPSSAVTQRDRTNSPRSREKGCGESACSSALLVGHPPDELSSSEEEVTSSSLSSSLLLAAQNLEACIRCNNQVHSVGEEDERWQQHWRQTEDFGRSTPADRKRQQCCHPVMQQLFRRVLLGALSSLAAAPQHAQADGKR